ncbi:MAG: outer membrane lipoprotein carrier protein LolA [bacterium]
MNRFLLYSAILTSLLLSFASIHSADSKRAQEIIKKVQEKYKDLKTLSADFEQEFVWELAGETQVVKGLIYLGAANHYRIETDTQTIVADGTTLWTYSEPDNQVIIDSMKKSVENPLPRDLLFQYAEEYTPSLVGEEKLDDRKTYVLSLTPKDEEAFIKSMKIWVDETSWLTIKVVQVDINDNVNTYTIENIKEDVELQPSLFSFQIPADSEVVDLREGE